MSVGGATSLVQLIMKAAGDDGAKAVRDLVDAGYPKEVAERIASGELPMDPASIRARKNAQTSSDSLLHGSTHDIQQFDGYRTNPSNDSGQGTYLTDSTYDVNENYAGTHGPDFRARAVDRAEQGYSGDADLDLDELIMQAEQELQGPNQGVVYPLRILNDAKMANYSDDVPFDAVDDYIDDAVDSLLTSYPNETKESLLDVGGDYYDEVIDEAHGLMFENEGIGDTINDVLTRYDYDGTLGTDLQVDAAGGGRYTWNDVRDRIDDEIETGRLWADDGNGNNIGSGGLLAEVLEELDYDGVVDSQSPDRFGGMGAGEHTIVFPGREHVIRSENAAYDPQYKGKNIMGGAAGTAGLTGLLAAGQSDEADAGVAARLINPEVAYNQLRKLVARNKQNGISPGNTVKQWIHDKANSNYDHMGAYARKVDGDSGGDYYKEQTQSLVDQLLDGVDSPDKDLMAGLEEWSGIRQARELGYRPDYLTKGAAGGTAAGVAGTSNAGESQTLGWGEWPTYEQPVPTSPQERGFGWPLPTYDELVVQPRAPRETPTGWDILGSVGNILGAPMAGVQGLARGAYGLLNGEDLATAGAEAAHMMGAEYKNGTLLPRFDSDEGWKRYGEHTEEVLGDAGMPKPIAKGLGAINRWVPSLFAPF